MTCKQLYMALFVLLLSSCGGSGRYDGALRRAQSVLNARPDSALLILDSLAPVAPSMSRPTLMRWQLLRTQAQNKCDTVFRSDSLQLALVDYYDRHGTPNERMTAHYLLGRAYSDMGEAPLALEAYLNAVSCADTASADCDWWNMCRVMGQISYIYYNQNMPEEELEILNRGYAAAMKAGDTVTAIVYRAKKAGVYDLLGMEDSVAVSCIVASSMFDEIGRRDLAAGTLGMVASYQISKCNYDDALKNMLRYEHESGFFDSHGDIVPGKEYYYCIKGRYFLGLGQMDSAFHYFDKVMKVCDNPDNLHAACQGLMAYYQKLGKPDSLVRYAMLSEQYKDSSYAQTYTENLQRMKKMYDFTRLQEKNHSSELRLAKESRRNGYLLVTALALVTAMGLIISYLRAQRVRTKKDIAVYSNRLCELEEEKSHLLQDSETASAELERSGRMMDALLEAHVFLKEVMGQMEKGSAMSAKGEEALRSFDKVAKENAELRESLREKSRLMDEFIRRKNKEIDELTAKISSYVSTKAGRDAEHHLMDTEIMRQLRILCYQPESNPTEDQWGELESEMKSLMPGFHQLLQDARSLNLKEKRICFLVRVGFKPKEIASLMGETSSSVSMLRTRIYSKLFGGKGSGRDLDRMLKSYV